MKDEAYTSFAQKTCWKMWIILSWLSQIQRLTFFPKRNAKHELKYYGYTDHAAESCQSQEERERQVLASLTFGCTKYPSCILHHHSSMTLQKQHFYQNSSYMGIWADIIRTVFFFFFLSKCMHSPPTFSYFQKLLWQPKSWSIKIFLSAIVFSAGLHSNICDHVTTPFLFNNVIPVGTNQSRYLRVSEAT